MSNLLLSLKKRSYLFSVKTKLRKEWNTPYSFEDEGFTVIPCRMCPKFDSDKNRCSVPFGSPLRKCVTASIEANLSVFSGIHALEIGCGNWSYAKQILEHTGSSWVGVDPLPAKKKIKSIRTTYGHAASLPFDNQSFDLVFGIQTLEHFVDRHEHIAEAASYEQCLGEIWRVLKPGGAIYFDVPIHHHGHEMFIMGDTERIKNLFHPGMWKNLSFQKWRYDYAPLAKYPPRPGETVRWPACVCSYPAPEMEKVRDHGFIWLLTIQAKKTGDG
ncbi:Methyltransferase type 11 [Chlorobium limicola DSM 245]|uniref:Methyltransferase type 11 n=1 Tax=Chlorobium limicola (strain DSM 245 / NBRC 103803 / 6330) TaxID=290315 RepID=B3EFD5_CHLL2|nr:class I SAM-dependent methyltransferase [Chlorobium limicola]ACD89418.1 Methyltransferase type 11 [Chlorobium limicola DSM 245]